MACFMSGSAKSERVFFRFLFSWFIFASVFEGVGGLGGRSGLLEEGRV